MDKSLPAFHKSASFILSNVDVREYPMVDIRGLLLDQSFDFHR